VFTYRYISSSPAPASISPKTMILRVTFC
jgi:hypothetical protein